MQGVATTAPPPEGLDVIDVPAGTWAVFRTEGTHPVAAQASCSSGRVRALGPEHRPGPAGYLDHVEPFRRVGGGRHAVQVGELAALGAVGVEVVADREHSRGLGVVQRP